VTPPWTVELYEHDEGGCPVRDFLEALDKPRRAKVVAIIAPRLIGGAEAPTPVDGAGPVGLPGGLRVRDVQVRRLGEDIVIEGYREA